MILQKIPNTDCPLPIANRPLPTAYCLLPIVFIALLCLCGQLHAQGPADLPDMSDEAKPGWTERRAFKFAEITALHLAGAFDAYTSNDLIDNHPPDIPGKAYFWEKEFIPWLRPFAGHWTMYPAVQIGDAALSAWLLRAHGSRSRKAAWTITSLQIGMHIGFGLNNLHLHNAQWQFYREIEAGRRQ